MKEKEMGRACNTHGGDGKCIHSFYWKTLTDETSKETLA